MRLVTVHSLKIYRVYVPSKRPLMLFNQKTPYFIDFMCFIMFFTSSNVSSGGYILFWIRNLKQQQHQIDVEYHRYYHIVRNPLFKIRDRDLNIISQRMETCNCMLKNVMFKTEREKYFYLICLNLSIKKMFIVLSISLENKVNWKKKQRERRNGCEK